MRTIVARSAVVALVAALGLGIAACGSSGSNASGKAHKAHADTTATACRHITTTLASVPKTLHSAIVNPKKSGPAVKKFTGTLLAEAKPASRTVRKSVDHFVAEMRGSLTAIKKRRTTVKLATRRLNSADGGIRRTCRAKR